MTVLKYKNSAGTEMARLLASFGYQLTKDGIHFKTIVYCPVEEIDLWKEVKGQK